MILSMLLLVALAQPSRVSGIVTDATGAPMSGVVVIITADSERKAVTTAADGSWTAAVHGDGTVLLRVDAPGFASVSRSVTPGAGTIKIELRPEGIAEQVIVTAESVRGRLSVEGSITSIDRSTIAAAPALRLDDQLRLVPGFSLFRRTSSTVANPTTQGVTLRGLSASGASRTLVVADEVPLNDPFGGWVYWNRIPIVALHRVDVVRGASGDLHGNDALGGVIRLTTRSSRGAEGWLDLGNRGTGRASAYGALSRTLWNAGAAVETATTDGYRVVAPEARGSIDTAADSQGTSAMAWAGRTAGAFESTLRGGYFTEQRGNGTPAQLNATVTRWSGANAHGLLGGGVWEARGDLSTTNYRQTFSAVASGRATERLTNLQWVGSAGDGAAFDWLRQTSRLQTLIAINTRTLRADLDEASFSLAGVESGITRTSARQRGEGLVLQGRLDVSPRVVVDAGARADHWRLTRASPDLTRDHGFFEPRVGLSVRVADDRTLRIAWLSGFRTPTMNELYRSFRVGNTTTSANGELRPEKSWGPEIAFTIRRARWTGRAVAYLTRLDGAIYNRTVSSTASPILRERSNGDARTIGSELELDWRFAGSLALTTSWALNDSTFTSGELEGKRVPQVPRVGGSIGARGAIHAWSAAASIRISGAQFDDDRNDFKLRRGWLVDARTGWRLSRRVEVFGAVENALDEELDTGKTPIRTVGAPRAVRAGVAIRF
jgi:outer membrane receptor protein involved in Fe transport